MMVGNGVTNWKYDTFPATFEMGNWHSLFEPFLWQRSQELNCDFSKLNWGV
jgi:hypothetical protein